MVELVISDQSIQDKILELARDIDEHYKSIVDCDSPLYLIGNSDNGSFIFMADLIRKLSIPRKYCFVSYNFVNRNDELVFVVNQKTVCPSSIKNSHILLVEPVVGYENHNDINQLIEQFNSWGSASIQLISMLIRIVPHAPTLEVNWFGFKVDYFPEGYGMGYLGKNIGMNGIYRNTQYLLRHSQDTMAGEFIVLSADSSPTCPIPSNLGT